jgi:hypothetical protein
MLLVESGEEEVAYSETLACSAYGGRSYGSNYTRRCFGGYCPTAHLLWTLALLLARIRFRVVVFLALEMVSPRVFWRLVHRLGWVGVGSPCLKARIRSQYIKLECNRIRGGAAAPYPIVETLPLAFRSTSLGDST